MTDGATIRHALEALLEAFNAHDLDRIMGHFATDCVLDLPRGPEIVGRRLIGHAAVREGLRSRFTGLPDVRYSDAEHMVAGEVGISLWTVSGTPLAGSRVEARGCDFYTFRDGLVVSKNSFWKLRE